MPSRQLVLMDEDSTPGWLKNALATAEIKRRKKLPHWAEPHLLPPLADGDLRLNDDQMAVVMQLLASTHVSERHPLLRSIREHVAASVREEFVWWLFEAWQENGAENRHKWALGAIGHLGDDASALKLAPLIRAWPGESRHQRAVFGLECLRAIGSNTALMQLSGIAQKVRYRGLKAKAGLFVEEIANEKGLTREQLEDRVIPDCGLDEWGRREFSFGRRSFTFVLGEDLKPMVRDDSGKIRANLPKPGVKDDECVAKASLSDWKLLKKQIKEVASVQSRRLEQAMVTGRRWSVSDFETLFMRHPLMTHLVQKLIWDSKDEQGRRQQLFRVTEERDFANQQDEPIRLNPHETVGVVHPLELSTSERAAWGELLSDYEIRSPFPQLGREVYTLESDEQSSKELTRFHGMCLSAPALVYTLENFGWSRGAAMDGGEFEEHSKQFPAAGVTAVIGYSGSVAMGAIDPEEILVTDTVHFCPGMRPPLGYDWRTPNQLPLRDVPEIVISEVIAELQVLKSKAR